MCLFRALYSGSRVLGNYHLEQGMRIDPHEAFREAWYEGAALCCPGERDG